MEDSSGPSAGDKDHANSKKRKQSSLSHDEHINKTHRNSYKGFERRVCICRHGEKCLDAFKAFVDAGDRKRCGYFYVPSANLQKNQLQLVKHQRQSIHNCLWNSGCKPPPPTEKKEFIAYHHFHPDILQYNNHGPIKEVDRDTAKRIGLTKSDIKDPGQKIYFPAPNYPEAEWTRDSKSALAAMRPISDFVLESPRPKDDFLGSESDLSSDDSTAHGVSLLRPSPFVRKVQATYRWIQENPIEASMEMVKLREQLDHTYQMLQSAKSRADELAALLKEKLKKLEHALETQKELETCGGLTRHTATSLEWHKSNPKFAHHLWGLGTFEHVTCYVTEVFFPEVNVEIGKNTNDPFTDFEQILICIMRIHRDYSEETLTRYWGKKSHSTVSDAFNKWIPRLGRMGLCASILDLDFNLDYLSAADATRFRVDHSSFAPASSPSSYIEAGVPAEFRRRGYEKVGALVDGKVFMTDTVRVSSVLSRMLCADKVDNSGGLVMTWSTPTGLVFEHTGLFFAHCPETRLIELWGMVNPDNIRFATE